MSGRSAAGVLGQGLGPTVDVLGSHPTGTAVAYPRHPPASDPDDFATTLDPSEL